MIGKLFIALSLAIAIVFPSAHAEQPSAQTRILDRFDDIAPWKAIDRRRALTL